LPGPPKKENGSIRSVEETASLGELGIAHIRRTARLAVALPQQQQNRTNKVGVDSERKSRKDDQEGQHLLRIGIATPLKQTNPRATLVRRGVSVVR